MNTSITDNRKNILLFIELIVLLTLPVLNLNILYLILVLVITFLTKYFTKEKFSDYGFYTPALSSVFMAISIGLFYGLISNLVIDPLISNLTNKEVDLGGYEKVKGNLWGFLGLLALGWIVGGLFEEVFFRGYLYKRMRRFIEDPLIYKVTVVFVTSIVFAFAHSYQGISGIIGTFIFSIVMGILYFLFNKNVWCLVLVHGFYDTVGITMIYFGN